MVSTAQLRTFAAAALLAGSAFAQTREAPPSRELSSDEIAQMRAAALAEYAAGDWASYLRFVQQLSMTMPNHPGMALRLAAAQARAGKKTDALATLQAIADSGVTVDLGADRRNADDFASIAADPQFARFEQRIAENSQPIAKSTPWHRFADAGLVTEDVSFSDKERAYYVSSVLEHRLLRIGADGRESDFPLQAPENKWNVAGVAVDAKRGVIWVSAQALRGFPGIAEADAGKSRLSAYGLKSRRRLFSREFVPQSGHNIAIGDIALTKNGDVLAMDSQGGNVYRLSADRRSLDQLHAPFLSPQDAAVSEDGNIAFIADYQRGIARLDLQTGVMDWISAPPSIALSGIDGLYRYRNGLLAIQNGVQPERIAWFTLDAEQKRITQSDVFERGGDALGEPTHGVVVGDTFVFLANSGWNKLDDHGVLRAGASFTPAELRKIDLLAVTNRVGSIAPGIWLLRGAMPRQGQPDGNSIVFEAPQGLVMMDTGRHAEHTQQLIDFAHLHQQSVAAIVNSHWHLDHVSGNPLLRRAFPRLEVYASDAIDEALKGFLPRYRALLDEMIPESPPEQRRSLREEMARIDAGRALRPDQVVRASGSLRIAGKDFTVGLEKNAVTAGDVWLLDPQTHTLASGDLVTLPAPFLDTACPAGWKTALDHLAAADFTQLIPGHGAPMTRERFETYRTAFGKLLDCASSPRDKRECIDGWLSDAGALIEVQDRELARSQMDYYLDQRLRGPTATAACAS